MKRWLLFLICFPLLASAQTIEVAYAHQWVGQYELENPDGLAWRFT